MRKDRVVVEAADWLDAAHRARSTHGWFCYLDASDDIGRTGRIIVVLRVRDHAGDADLELVTDVDRDDGSLASIRAVWPAAGWAERGIAESFGIHLVDGDDRPLLLGPDARGALRKDRFLARRQEPWPGAGDDPAQGRSRRRGVPSGVPDPAASTVEAQVASAYGAARGRR